MDPRRIKQLQKDVARNQVDRDQFLAELVAVCDEMGKPRDVVRRLRRLARTMPIGRADGFRPSVVPALTKLGLMVLTDALLAKQVDEV